VRFVDSGGFDFTAPAALGVILGLVVGKPLGIVAATYAANRFGDIPLPRGVGWRHVLGAGMLGGIGFTMSIFVANLAFEEPVLLNSVKAAVLLSSVVAGVVGYCYLRFMPSAEKRPTN
jgi:NhaA family Na+:H+ antiporter